MSSIALPASTSKSTSTRTSRTQKCFSKRSASGRVFFMFSAEPSLSCKRNACYAGSAAREMKLERKNSRGERGRKETPSPPLPRSFTCAIFHAFLVPRSLLQTTQKRLVRRPCGTGNEKRRIILRSLCRRLQARRGSNSTIELLLLLVFFFCEISHYFLSFPPKIIF